MISSFGNERYSRRPHKKGQEKKGEEKAAEATPLSIPSSQKIGTTRHKHFSFQLLSSFGNERYRRRPRKKKGEEKAAEATPLSY